MAQPMRLAAKIEQFLTISSGPMDSENDLGQAHMHKKPPKIWTAPRYSWNRRLFGFEAELADFVDTIDIFQENVGVKAAAIGADVSARGIVREARIALVDHLE
jgi:hypothetical protein